MPRLLTNGFVYLFAKRELRNCSCNSSVIFFFGFWYFYFDKCYFSVDSFLEHLLDLLYYNHCSFNHFSCFFGIWSITKIVDYSIAAVTKHVGGVE